ncbi:MULTISPECIES: protein translocase subunit SecD [unclassified Dehalobacter]|uniref:protein translocase subunit SecD n=1 Tax=unclassified Dehalobacter TaxID=2635733 RepID=UPI000E6BFDF1|nr:MULTISPECIES: protein translocase subunit SecD [unclassified Dehalobacter]RJE46762.1 protein-export membrane protein SecD [Dehalobacter sp. MCB1]TCX49277.1 protein translocase subunit SecD [Dehalobacter sp. 14DCB1]TCX49857.1 protein translocase subunit SecD [Dehalobacter sp. 12DCB1]
MKRGNTLKLAIAVILVAVVVFFSIQPLTDSKSGIPLGLDLRGGVHLVLQAEMGKDGAEITNDDMDKARAVIEERVNGLGVAEPYIQTNYDKKRIIVELAGVADPDEAVKVLQTTAKLTFRDPQGNILMDGSLLKDAKAAVDTSNGGTDYVVQISFASEGTTKFADITTKYLNQKIGIYLDERKIQDPVVSVPIVDGQGQIQGYSSLEEAAQYAVMFRSGALPVSMSIVEKNQVGALLGADSLNKSLNACVIALIFIFLFMLLLYRLPGLVADFSLVVFSVIVLWVLYGIGTVLTLPGIAGFVLSIGMAVDLNIIVYERIKEELKLGKSLRAAVDAGFSRAFITVFDSNITTIFAALALFLLGSASIKGFAITLIVGIVASLFTAITFTRWIMRWIVGINPRMSKWLFGVKEVK